MRDVEGEDKPLPPRKEATGGRDKSTPTRRVGDVWMKRVNAEHLSDNSWKIMRKKSDGKWWEREGESTIQTGRCMKYEQEKNLRKMGGLQSKKIGVIQRLRSNKEI